MRILSRFASTLEPPQPSEGYDKLITLTLAQHPPRDIVGSVCSISFGVCEIPRPCMSTPNSTQRGRFQSPRNNVGTSGDSRYSRQDGQSRFMTCGVRVATWGTFPRRSTSEYEKASVSLPRRSLSSTEKWKSSRVEISVPTLFEMGGMCVWRGIDRIVPAFPLIGTMASLPCNSWGSCVYS